MKKTSKTTRISFQEKVQGTFIDKSFCTYPEHLGFHLQQLKKSPDLIRNVVYNKHTAVQV